jgi:hypothetical protein
MEDRLPRDHEYVLVNVSIQEMVRRSEFLRQYLLPTQSKPEFTVSIEDDDAFPALGQP